MQYGWLLGAILTAVGLSICANARNDARVSAVVFTSHSLMGLWVCVYLYFYTNEDQILVCLNGF